MNTQTLKQCTLPHYGILSAHLHNCSPKIAGGSMVEVGLRGKKNPGGIALISFGASGVIFFGVLVDFIGEVEVGEVFEEFVGFSVVGFGGFDFVVEGATQ